MFVFYAIVCMIVNDLENKNVLSQWEIGYRSGI